MRQPCVRKELAVQAGYNHFFAGNYLADTGASDDADFAYVRATLDVLSLFLVGPRAPDEPRE